MMMRCIYLFVVYLTALSAAQTTVNSRLSRLMKGRICNNNWKSQNVTNYFTFFFYTSDICFEKYMYCVVVACFVNCLTSSLQL
jgi:hypothetical protein